MTFDLNPKPFFFIHVERRAHPKGGQKPEGYMGGVPKTKLLEIMENQMETTIMENQMEKKMENEMETLGPFKGVYRDITPIMENQMEKKMENDMETGII